mgnify:CR=1 FL=1
MVRCGNDWRKALCCAACRHACRRRTCCRRHPTPSPQPLPDGPLPSTLPPASGEDEVRNQLTEAFAAAGTVVNVRLPTDRETGELKGIGFIEFDSSEAKVGG